MRIATAEHSQRRDSAASSFDNCLSWHIDLGLQQGMFTRGFLVFGKDQPSDLLVLSNSKPAMGANKSKRAKTPPQTASTTESIVSCSKAGSSGGVPRGTFSGRT